jgi:hypothetical protein
MRRMQKQISDLAAMAEQFAQRVGAGGEPPVHPIVEPPGKDAMTELVKRRFLRDHEPWLFQLEEELAATRGELARVKTDPAGARTAFLLKLLKFAGYSEDTGMSLLYAHFEPDQRSFWDLVCATQAPPDRIKLHNLRLLEQAIKDPTKCPAAERILPAILVLTQPLMPWEAAATDVEARAYNAALIEAAQAYAKVLRDQHQNRGRELAGAGPPSRLKNLPKSPFKSQELMGGEPFAVIVTAPDGTQAVDLAPLNEYLLTLEQRIGAHFGHNAEVVKKAFHDAIVSRFGDRRTGQSYNHSAESGQRQQRQYTQDYVPRQAYAPKGKRQYAPRGGEAEHGQQQQPQQQQQQQQQPQAQPQHQQQQQQQQQQHAKNFF